MVSTFRAGLDVYTDSPLGRLCKEFIFSRWPSLVFESFDKDYRTVIRELRGPGCAIDLPPVTALVLSRAARRQLIPQTIRELRDEYEEDRNKLWTQLGDMWKADSLRDQVEIFRSLSDATRSIFKAAYPERYDVLSLGLDFANLSPSGVTAGLKRVRERNLPSAKVRAVSFAERLSKDFRRNLLGSKKILRRHLTLSEYHDFGLG